MGRIAGKNRRVCYDVLRIVAAFSVVMLHSAAQFWYTLDINSREWLVANSYNSVFRFGVPVFVMISGALFLDNEYELDIKRLYRHNILRLAVLFVIWSAIYGAWDCRFVTLRELGIVGLLREMVYGKYHLWFLPMLIGIYMLLPILKEWLEHARMETLRYFLLLFFVVQICRETFAALTTMGELEYILGLGKVDMVCSYIGYFLWGYYLSHVGVGDKLRRVIYIGALPAALCNILLGNYLALKAGAPVAEIYDSYGIFTFVIVTAVYVFAVEHINKPTFDSRAGRLIRELSADTLGVYLLHIGLLEGLEQIGLHNMLITNVIGIPLQAILCFAICIAAAALLRRIPVVGKYLC